MSSSTDYATTQDLPPRHRALSEIREIDAKIAEKSAEVDALKERREHLERLAVEEMTAQRLDGVKVAGRSWRIEWTHSMSAAEGVKNDVIEALNEMGIDTSTVTQINTARLKAILKEDAERRGIDIRQSWIAGTPLEGKAGEFVAPRLRFTTAG